MSERVELGQRARDRLTGFEGIVICRNERLTAVTQLCIESTDLREGKPIGDQWFDEARVEAVPDGKPDFGFLKVPRDYAPPGKA